MRRVYRPCRSARKERVGAFGAPHPPPAQGSLRWTASESRGAQKGREGSGLSPKGHPHPGERCVSPPLTYVRAGASSCLPVRSSVIVVIGGLTPRSPRGYCLIKRTVTGASFRARFSRFFCLPAPRRPEPYDKLRNLSWIRRGAHRIIVRDNFEGPFAPQASATQMPIPVRMGPVTVATRSRPRKEWSSHADAGE
jgi:hypothetical protein